MKITLPKTNKAALENDLLILGIFKAKTDEKKATLKGVLFEDKPIKELDKVLAGFLVDAAHHEGFAADDGQNFITATLGQAKAHSIALLGLGKEADQTVDLFRRFGGEAFKIAQKKRAKKVSLMLPKGVSVPLFDVVKAITEGLHLAHYRFDRYLTRDKKDHYIKEIEFLLPEQPSAEHKTALGQGEAIAAAVCRARDLINEGPMVMNPAQFADVAEKVAQESGLKVDILDEKKLRKENMNLMLAVGSASQSVAAPRLIRLHYQPKKNSKIKVVLAGKGVTFDSGGLDIKPADGMLDMKVDMSGAAAVLGCMQAIAYLEPKVEVFGYMACVENGVGPHAYHPGDIITSRKGITVEINNTDAEGRLVLADAINYATEHDKPDVIIDIATLTGACMVALGVKTAGLFANDDELAHALKQSGKTVGEDFWRLPINNALKEVLKSPIADIKNCGDRYGGSITATLFLSEFIEKGIKWAHLDIAGPATNNKPHAYLPTGGVGFGVRTLVDYLMSL